VLEWVEDGYGHDKVAHIITYGPKATKNAIKDVARVENSAARRGDSPLQADTLTNCRIQKETR
jgi:DNA polymerase III, alpha subunit